MTPKQPLLPGVTSMMTGSSPTHFCSATYWEKKNSTFIFSREQISGTTWSVMELSLQKASGAILITGRWRCHFFLFESRLSPSAHLPGHVLPVPVCPSINSFPLARHRRPQSRPSSDCDPRREGGQFPQCDESNYSLWDWPWPHKPPERGTNMKKRSERVCFCLNLGSNHGTEALKSTHL